MSTEEKSKKKLFLILAALIALIIIAIVVVIQLGGKKKEEESRETKTPTATATASVVPTSSEKGEEDVTPTVTQEPAVTAVTEPSEAVSPTKAEVSPTKTEVAPTKSETKITPRVTNAPVKAETGSPVENHGKLSVKGTKIVDENGKQYQLKGVSTHGIAWFPAYVNKAAFQTLRDEWGANVIRLAMYSGENAGYANGDEANRTKLKNLVKNGVQYATELGLYVIIDWHVLGDQTPLTYQAEAKKFFDEMSKLYKDYDNVIYEICNEPNGGTSWSDIKRYASVIIPIIRANDKDAIIIVGTPNWSQYVDQAAADPITGQTNIMYALHFYAATHKDDLRNKMISAAKAGLPIFCSEFGITDASGNGNYDEASANKWVSVMNELGISYVCWSLSNKNETSALIRSSCNKLSGWSESEITGEAKWLIKAIKGTLSDLGSIDVDKIIEDAPDNSNDNGNNNSGNTDSSVPKPINFSKTVNSCTVNLQASNTWREGGASVYGMSLSIKNTKSTAVDNWKLVITFSADVKVVSLWCGKYTVSGNKLTITPENYNGTIAAGQELTGIGLNLSASQDVTISSVSITY